MIHETQGKRWPSTAGVEADYITVDVCGDGSAAAARLRLYGIPHTTISARDWFGGNYATVVLSEGRSAPKPPTLEGWSFSVYSGAEEHASGWGSATLADMAPALLAAVGMSDGATANKRAQAAENLAQSLAGDRDGAVEALDIANDTLGKLCAVMAGAGFNGDLLSEVQTLIKSREGVIKERDAAKREIADVVDTLGPSRTPDSAKVLAKRARTNLNRWEAFTREHAASALDLVALVTDISDRHFDLRLALGAELKSLRERPAVKPSMSDMERQKVIDDLQTALAAQNRELDGVKHQLSTLVKVDAANGQVLSDISRVLGPRRGDEPVTAQAERARKILDCWHTLALKHLPDCPQLRRAGHGNAGFDLGTLHFELRGFMSGEISALRDRISLAAEREDLTIAALGHPCSTNGIPEAVRATSAELDITKARLTTSEGDNATLRAILAGYTEREAEIRRDLGLPSNNDVVAGVEHVTSEVRRYRHCADSLAAENAHLQSSLAATDSVVRLVTAALETPEGVLVTEHAAIMLKQSKSAAMWEDEARKAWNYGDQIARVLPKGGPTDGLLERAVTLAGEVTRLREQCRMLEDRRSVDAENEATWIVWAHQWACQLLAEPSAENLRWTIGKRIEDMRTDLRVSREVLENIARVTEYPSGTSLVDHVAKVYKNSERANRMTEEVARLNRAMENTGGYGAREAAKALRKENESLRKALDAWQTWGHNRAGVTATLSDNKLRAAIDTYDAAYCAPALTTDSKEALDYLIAHPGHGLTAELALAGAKRLRGHVEHGLPALNPLRSLIELALLSGVNEAHNAWDAEVAKYRDEAAKAYKRLDQWLIWGLRAACVINADDDSLRMLIDRALPMWRRGTPEV